MRHYECTCAQCGQQTQIAFSNEPYPQIGERFPAHCTTCNAETMHTRTLTRKLAAAMRAAAQEEQQRQAIVDKCNEYGFKCRFLYQSVIITTPLADWCFDYHQQKITLYHESTMKINFATGNYAKSHVQFRERRMRPLDVIAYIANHDVWRANHSPTAKTD